MCLLLNILHSFWINSFSLSVKLFAGDAKLCWKYLIVSRNITWLPMLAKLIFVGFFHPIRIYFVLQTPAFNLFIRKKKSNLKRLCANTAVFVSFSLTSSFQKLCAYPITSLDMCEWWMWILLLLIPFILFINFFWHSCTFIYTVIYTDSSKFYQLRIYKS